MPADSPLTSRTYPLETADPAAAIEFCYEQGWTDGLPVVPPTPERVLEFCQGAGREPQEVLGYMEARQRLFTVEKVAVNAVMAGCRPEYFAVVLTAVEAMLEDPFNFNASAMSTGGGAPLCIVHGPWREELGFNSGVNCFGPGNRANATVGRALRLVIMNVAGGQPGVFDKSTLGHPGKYSYCVAEADAEGWPSLGEDLGLQPGQSGVTLFTGEGPHYVSNHISGDPEGVLATVAGTIGGLGSFAPGRWIVVLAPEVFGVLRHAGWSKMQAREFLAENARRSVADLKRGGKRPGAVEPGDEEEFVHAAMDGPESIWMMVAGGVVGGFSAVIPPWVGGNASIPVTRAAP